MKFLFALTALFQISGFSFALAKNLSGVVLEKGTKKPLAGASVLFVELRQKTETDDKGQFVVNVESEDKDFHLKILKLGYNTFEDENFSFAPTDSTKKNKIYLTEDKQNVFETLVRSQKNQRDTAKKSLDQSQFLNMPGAGGDPVKAVQNLPGVNRVAGFSSQVVIQGASPNDTVYQIAGHEVPNVFHFGGLTSVVTPEAIEQVEYFSAGYGATYSRSLSGVINLQPRDPDVADRAAKGFFFVDTLKSGGLIEAKISDSQSILIAGRFSYIGLILREALKNNKDINLTVAPEFADLNINHKWNINPNDTLRTNFIYSKDSLEFLLKEPLRADPGLRGAFVNRLEFVRLIPEWTRTFSSDEKIKLSVALGLQKQNLEIGTSYFKNSFSSITVRGEKEQSLSSKWKTAYGIDNQYYRADVTVKAPVLRDEGGVSNPFSSGEQRETTITARPKSIGLFWTNEILSESESLKHLPSLRLDYFSQTKEFAFGPRYAADLKVTENLNLKTGSGLYYQSPEPREQDPTFGNPNLKANRAFHLTAGFDYDWKLGAPENRVLSGQLFWKELDRLVANSDVLVTRDGSQTAEIFNNEGRGRVVGLELQWKYKKGVWENWIAYTLSKSTRRTPLHPEYLFEFDQTHNINWILGYSGFSNWKLSSRARYVTGNPRTPVIGANYDADNDVYQPLRGDFYSERAKDFFQLDFRADLKRIYDENIYTLYFDIQNILLTKNSEAVQYSYDYKTKSDVTGVPILISIGVKGEY
jgi:hypothetical protein